MQRLLVVLLEVSLLDVLPLALHNMLAFRTRQLTGVGEAYALVDRVPDTVGGVVESTVGVSVSSAAHLTGGGWAYSSMPKALVKTTVKKT